MPNLSELYKHEKIVAIVPVHNEQGYVEQVTKSLLSLQKVGIIYDFRFVANGCTDNTVMEAKNAGAAGKIIELSRKGKGRGFVEGAHWANSVGATVMLTFDGDLAAFKPKQALPLIYPVLHGETCVAMAIAGMNELKEGTNQVLRNPNSHLSGMRAIRMTALKPLFNGNKRWRSWLGKEYHLEVAQSSLIKNHKFVQPNLIARRPAYRGSPAISVVQRQDVNALRKLVGLRQKRAQTLRAKRRFRAAARPGQMRIHGRN